MIEQVEDPADPRLADYVGLRDPARRSRIEPEGGYFIAEGETVIRRLLASGHRVRSVLLTPSRHRRLAEVLAGVEAPVYLATREVMAAVAGFDLHRGAVASAYRRPASSPDDLRGSVAVLEGINDHENLGAIFRSAGALGIGGVLLDPSCADPYYRRSVRVSMGAVLTLPFARAAGWPADLARVGRGRTAVALTLSSSARPLDEVAPVGDVAVVLGAEGPGLRPETVRVCDVEATIPMAAPMDSLNVGHAAAIAFHRLVR